VVRSQPGQIVLKTLSRKKPTQKSTGGVAQDVDPEFKPQYCKKKTVLELDRHILSVGSATPHLGGLGQGTPPSLLKCNQIVFTSKTPGGFRKIKF
jgi:hypothetical protein